MKTTKQNENVIYSYGREEAIDDGILMVNPRQNKFEECDIITTNLFDKLSEVANIRNTERVFEISGEELVGCLMLYAKDVYDNNKFTGDDDKDFFTIPKTDEGVVIWFERNEAGKLTAMLPEDR